MPLHSKDTHPWSPKEFRAFIIFHKEANEKPKRIILLPLAINSAMLALSQNKKKSGRQKKPMSDFPKGRWKIQVKMNLITIDDDDDSWLFFLLPSQPTSQHHEQTTLHLNVIIFNGYLLKFHLFLLLIPFPRLCSTIPSNMQINSSNEKQKSPSYSV